MKCIYLKPSIIHISLHGEKGYFEIESSDGSAI